MKDILYNWILIPLFELLCIFSGFLGLLEDVWRLIKQFVKDIFE